MTLQGDESIFAIDGQHRALSIRKAIKEDNSLRTDEIAAIFVAHKTTEEGKIRTRRLFSTLNKFAKPVSRSEIIALSEDNNCAVITRYLVDEFNLFKGKILVIKNRSINPDNQTAFTNIMVLYDIVERLLTDKPVVGIKVTGRSKNDFTSIRTSDKETNKAIKEVEKIFSEIKNKIPSLKVFLMEKKLTGQKKQLVYYSGRSDKIYSLMF